MTIPLKHSKLWTAERDNGSGRPYKNFTLRDPSFYGVKRADVYRDGNHWNYVYWDIANHDHRPGVAVGYTSPEQAAKAMVTTLATNALVIAERIGRLAREFD